MKNIVTAIVKNSDNKTIRVEAIVNGQNRTFTKEQLVAIKEIGFKFDNAIILSDGAVRGTKGELKKKFEKNLKRVTTIENKDIIQATRMISSKEIMIYHGTKEVNLIPKYGFGKKNNDYGQGFYTTQDKELAKEWAYAEYTKGVNNYVYSYKVSLQGLNILDLTKLNSLHWVALLIANRQYSLNLDSNIKALIKARAQWIKERYLINISNYDIVIGYRADDKYFSYVTAFLSGAITIEMLEKAMRFGSLGLQVFIKSKRAFNLINKGFIGKEEVPVIYNKYRKLREQKAVDDYKKLMKNRSRELLNGKTIADIIREENNK